MKNKTQKAQGRARLEWKTEFKFWVENKIANEITLGIDDIRARFKEWLKTKENNWLEYYGSWGALQAFVGEKGGLNAACEQEDYDALQVHLRDEYIAHLYHDPIKQVSNKAREGEKQ